MWKSTYLSSAQPIFPMLFVISSSSALSSLANSKISLQGIVQHVSPPETTICSWSATPFTWDGFSCPLLTVFITGSPAFWASWGCSLCKHVTPSVLLLESLRAHCSALMWLRWMCTRIEVASSPADARKVNTRTTFLLNIYSCKEWQSLGHKNIIARWNILQWTCQYNNGGFTLGSRPTDLVCNIPFNGLYLRTQDWVLELGGGFSLVGTINFRNCMWAQQLLLILKSNNWTFRGTHARAWGPKELGKFQRMKNYTWHTINNVSWSTLICPPQRGAVSNAKPGDHFNSKSHDPCIILTYCVKVSTGKGW